MPLPSAEECVAQWSSWSTTDYDEREEFSRSVSIALLGVTPEGSASFVPKTETSLPSDWVSWCEDIFYEIIGPAFCATYEFGSQLKFREVAAIDEKLGLQLPAFSRNLIENSRPFIEGKEEMRGHPEWVRYVRKLESGKAPGHLPIVFAIHSILYRLPLATSLLAYAWLEWKSGYRALGLESKAGDSDDPPPVFLEAKKQIPLFINGRSGGGNAPGLRAI